MLRMGEDMVYERSTDQDGNVFFYMLEITVDDIPSEKYNGQEITVNSNCMIKTKDPYYYEGRDDTNWVWESPYSYKHDGTDIDEEIWLKLGIIISTGDSEWRFYHEKLLRFKSWNMV